MKDRSKANKGQSFEDMIEQANNFYYDRGIAAIVKVPTSFKIQRRYNPLKRINEIVGAWPEKKSTVDFIGQAWNMPISFEAKSTSNKSNFPLKNIKDHQMRWLQQVDSLGGCAFILIEVIEHEAIYRMTYKQLNDFIKSNKRKSIPLDFFDKFCHKVTFNRFFVIDYLKDL